MTISSISSVTPTHLNFLDDNRSSELYESIILDIAQELNLTGRLTFLHYKEKQERHLIFFKLDLSHQYLGLTTIKLKENDKQLSQQIKFVFQFVNQRFKELGFVCSCAISILNLSQNHISENSFLSNQETISEEKENRYLMVSILNDIENISLNETKVSTRILDYLCVCKKLKVLKLDKCQKILDFAKPILNQIFPYLHELSLVNMSTQFTHDDLLLERIEEIAPQISQIDLTQTFDKCLGMMDNIQQDVIIRPLA